MMEIRRMFKKLRHEVSASHFSCGAVHILLPPATWRIVRWKNASKVQQAC